MVAPWAEREMASADPGDRRLNGLAALGSQPNLSIPAACAGRAEMTAAYPFFDNDRVAFEGVLQRHVDRTLGRMRGEPVVILAQDTTVPNVQTEPGPQTVWIGPQRMRDLAWAWDAFGPGGETDVKRCV